MTSRLVSPFKAEVLPCPRCVQLPVEITLTKGNGATRHRFVCWDCEMAENPWSWKLSHKAAAEKWNAYAKEFPKIQA